MSQNKALCGVLTSSIQWEYKYYQGLKEDLQIITKLACRLHIIAIEN